MKSFGGGDAIKKEPWEIDDDYRNCDRTTEVFALIDRDPHLSYDLPPPCASAGRVLKHAIEVFLGAV